MIKQVGEIFYRHKDELKNTRVYLFEIEKDLDTLPIETPVPSDFVTQPIAFDIATIKREQECKHPLGSVWGRYFTQEPVLIAKGDFKLQLSGLPNASLLEKKLFDHYEKGHKENQNKTKAKYSAIEGVTLSNIKGHLDELQRDDKRNLNLIKEALLRIANQIPHDDDDVLTSEKAKAYNVLMSRVSEQKHVISISELFTVFLQQKPELLTAQNPFLTQQAVNQIFALLADYALLHSRVDQIDEALNCVAEQNTLNEVEPYQLQLFAGILDKPRAYNIKEYPEFLVYEYASKRIIRDDQVKILIKIMKLLESDKIDDEEMHHCLLQFAAGGGKTSLLITILAQRFARKGFLPVIFNTSELYTIGLEEIPKNLRPIFQQNIEVIERELEHVWTEKELIQLRQDLERWRVEGKCLLIKPVTWHSINITMKLGHFNQNPEIAKAAQDVLDFFKNKCVKLEDECQIISDPMQQSIKTYGRMRKIPDEQLDLLLRFYDYVMAYEEKSGEIAELAGVKSNRKRSITPEELSELQQKLANVIANEDAFKDIPRDQLIGYLLQPGRKRPDWLSDLYYSWNSKSGDKDEAKAKHERKIADLIVLARAFIKTHLPHILSLQHLKDFGDSIHKGDLTAGPKHEGRDVTSHFGDHTLVAALTIQHDEQRGLLPAHTEHLLDQLIKDHKKERLWNHNLAFPTLAEQWLLRLIPDNYHFACSRDLTQELINHLCNDPRFFKNPEVIKKFLLQYALPQVKIPEERQTSTAAELQAGFKRSLLLSATPGLPETYPAFLKPENCFLEEAFEAQVIDTLLQEQNRGLCVLKESQTPADFFKQIPADLLKKMTTLIDRGALLTDFDPKGIIESYLNLDKNLVATQTAAYFSKEQMHLRSKAENVKEVPISGSALVEALKKQGIKPEKFLLLLFLELSKTTGTDIKRPFDDHAGLTVGKHQTVTETIQAAMRERQLLEKNAQSITWLMFQALYREIHHEALPDTFDPRYTFYWMIKNEAKETETKLINRAYQGIYQAITEIAWNETNKKPGDFQKIEHGFWYPLRQEQNLSPYQIYELDSSEDNTERVLRGYLRELLSKFEFNKKNVEIPKEALARIEKIIKETKDLIDELPNPPKTQLGAEVQQEMQTELQQEQEQEQEQRIKNKLDSANDFVYELEQYSPEHDNFKAIFEQKISSTQQRYQAVQLSGCKDIKQPELLLCPRHFNVIKTLKADGKTDKSKAEGDTEKSKAESDSEIEQLKDIKMMLVKIMPNNQMQYLACTASGAEYYSFLLNNEVLSEKDPSYALVSIEGKVLHTSNNISIPKCEQLVAREDAQKMLTYAHFLNGNINNPILLSQMIKELGWTKEQYERLANAIATVHVSQSPVSLLRNAALEKLCGWGDKKQQATTMNFARYRPPADEKNVVVPTQTLRAATVLENHIEDTAFPIAHPKHALEGYILGEQPAPIAKNTDELRLALLLKNIQAMTNKNNIAGKDLAIAKLNNMALHIANSLRSIPDRIQILQALYSEFKEFDQTLEKLNSQLQKYKDAEYLMVLKDITIKAIADEYTQFAEGKLLKDNREDLKEKLVWIASETSQQYKEVGRQTASVMQFFTRPSHCSLAGILNGTAMSLSQPQKKSNVVSISIEDKGKKRMP